VLGLAVAEGIGAAPRRPALHRPARRRLPGRPALRLDARAALTLAVLAVASIPFFPPWSTLADCDRVALRLAWLR
jgi:hypothetical protein